MRLTLSRDRTSRRLVAIFFLCLAGLFIVMVGVDQGRTMAWDSAIAVFFQAWQSPQATSVFLFITTIGQPLVLGTVAVAAGVQSLIVKRWSLAFLLLLGVLGSALVVFCVKQLLHRPQPSFALVPATGYSFPSDHAAMAVVVFGIVLVVLGKRVQSPALVFVVVFLSIIAVLLISFSRLYLEAHWASDILGGWLLGACWCTATLILAGTLIKK